MKIWTVDAFATRAYKGNPAAVMIVDEFPTETQCLEIADEMNLSQTAFVKDMGDNKFHLRWFTSKVEMTLCGHATLATAHILYQQDMVQNSNEKIRFETLGGPLYAHKVEKDEITLDFPRQVVGPVLNRYAYQELLQIHVLAAERAGEDLLLELDGEAKVREFNSAYVRIHDIAEYRGIIITAKAEQHYDFVTRYFAPKIGVTEDPVTGMANAKCADYWQKKLNKDEFLAYQASARGGEVQIKLQKDRVCLTGKSYTIIEGKWKQPLDDK